MFRLFMALMVCVLVSCNKTYVTENKIYPTPEATHAIPATQSGPLTKAALEGKKFYFLKSVVEVSQNAPQEQKLIPGIYAETNRIVEFRFNHDNVDVDSALQLFDSKSNLVLPKTLANFQSKMSNNGTLALSACADFTETGGSEPASLNISEDSEYDPEKNLLNLRCTKRQPNGTVYTLQYSFLRVPAEKSNYVAREYPRYYQKHFGYFKTTVKSLDASGIVTQKSQKHFLNRWNPEKKITYYFSKGFPERLKTPVRGAAEAWNNVLEKAIGKRPIEILENKGQELGSLGENIVYFSDRIGTRHSVLGYSPQFTSPETGEILKADLLLFGETVKHTMTRLRLWGEITKQNPLDGDASPLATPNSNDKDLLEDFPKYSQFASMSGSIPRLLENPVRYVSPVANQAPEKAERFYRRHADNHEHCITEMTSDFVSSIFPLLMKVNVTDEQLEAVVLTRLALHEFGHNLGLRHNFASSFDNDSSVMDYSFLQNEGPWKLGVYDEAAIQFGYGPDSNAGPLIAKKLLYCTDDEAGTSKNAICARFDKGKSLVELAEEYRRRYFLSYFVNNVSNDTSDLENEDPEVYLRKVAELILPIRLLHDYSSAIIRNNDNKNYLALWQLLGVLIEPKPSEAATPNPSHFTLPLPANADRHPLERDTITIDRSRLNFYVEQAKETLTATARNLFEVILSSQQSRTGNRPDFDDKDKRYQNLVKRGVLPDKILALYLITHLKEDPVSPGTKINFFDTYGKDGTFDLFRLLISNTTYSPRGKGMYLRAFYPLELRELALKILSKAGRTPGEHAITREFLQIDKVEGNADVVDKKKLLVEIEEFRKLRQELVSSSMQGLVPNTFLSSVSIIHADVFISLAVERYETLIASYVEKESPKLIVELRQELDKILPGQNYDTRRLVELEDIRTRRRALMRRVYERKFLGKYYGNLIFEREDLGIKRNLIKEVYSHQKNKTYYKAASELRDFKIVTATGAFIRDNLNVTEDFLYALYDLRTDLPRIKRKGSTYISDQSYANLVKEVNLELKSEENRFFNERLLLEKIYTSYELSAP